MYESFFGFKEKPFSLLPDPSLFYPSQIHREALTLLEYGLYNQAGFTVVTGEIGAGKTTLMRYLLDRLERDMTVGLISHTHQSLGRIMDWICAAFEIQAPRDDPIAQHQAFVDFLLAEYAKGRKTLLIIDEAQNLDREALEEIRLLSNVNSERDILLQLLLLGQPELRDQLRQPGLEQFIQRISASYHLGRLDQEDSCRYIRHRLRIAGGRPDIFTPDACHAIFHYSQGIPRLINLICDTALVFAYGAGERHIDGRAIDGFVRSDGSHLLFAIDGERIEPLPDYRPLLVEELEAEIRDIQKPPEPPDMTPTTLRARSGLDSGGEGDESTGPHQRHDSTKSQPDEPENIAPRLHTATPPPGSGASLSNFDYSGWSASDGPLGFDRSRPADSRRGGRRWGWEIGAMVAGVLAGIGLVGWYIQHSGLKGLTSPNAIEAPDPDSVEPPSDALADGPQPSATDAQPSEPRDAADSSATSPAPEPPGSTASTPAGLEHSESASDTPPFDVLIRLAQEPSGPETDPVAVEASVAEPLSLTETSDASQALEGSTQRAPISDATPETGAASEPMAAPVPDRGLDWLVPRLTELSIQVERLAPNHLRADCSRLIQFRDGSVSLDEGARALLARLAALLKEDERLRIHVITHTDSQGLAANNRVLSARRAADIALILRREGIAASRVTHEGKGMSEPKFSPEEERRLGPWINRRVEIDLIETDGVR